MGHKAALSNLRQIEHKYCLFLQPELHVRLQHYNLMYHHSALCHFYDRRTVFSCNQLYANDILMPNLVGIKHLKRNYHQNVPNA